MFLADSSSDSRQYLIVFARYPEPGKVKTRLIPDVGAESAALVYKQMTELTLQQARALKLLRPITIEVWFTGGSEAQMRDWLGSDLDYQSQPEGGLGERLSYAFQIAIAKGGNSVITIGTDCPELDAATLDRGFRELHHHDLILGPATDGGYYLIGMQRFIPELFAGIPWSTSSVLQKTVETSEKLGLTLSYLPYLTDVDTAKDLVIWERIKSNVGTSTCKNGLSISIVIPALNEAENLPQTLNTLGKAVDIEAIVVDGGSLDDTVKVAVALGARVISSTQSRAHQMNLGASAAKGDILLFLHADTCLPQNFDSLVRQTLLQPKAIAGAFELKIDGTTAGLRFVEWGVRMRSHLFQMPYGDQAIFLKASLFRSMGGFAELPIMEDFELIRRLKQKGQIAIAPAAVLTSNRRWQKLSVFRTTLINQLVIIGYLLGVSPARLAHWYRSLGK
jgi:uncharacterized protein